MLYACFSRHQVLLGALRVLRWFDARPRDRRAGRGGAGGGAERCCFDWMDAAQSRLPSTASRGLRPASAWGVARGRQGPRSFAPLRAVAWRVGREEKDVAGVEQAID